MKNRTMPGAAVAAAGLLAVVLTGSPAGAQGAGEVVDFGPNPAGPSPVTWTVPDEVCRVGMTVRGAGGGSGISSRPGGHGALVYGELAVAPGDVLTITVGEAGGDGNDALAATDMRAPGGYGAGPGGKSGVSDYTQFFGAGGGGGGSDVRVGAATPSDIMALAGGGGGGSAAEDPGQAGDGGAGGSAGQVGQDGNGGSTPGGGEGATQSGPGAGGAFGANGQDGNGMQGGTGGDGPVAGPSGWGGGGGGGGYFGGGGGSSSGPDPTMANNGGGGGGGSSFLDATVTTPTYTAGGGGAADQDGSVSLLYTLDPNCKADVPLVNGQVLGAGLVAAGIGALWVTRRRRLEA